MKLTKREAILLSILLIAAIIFLEFQLVYLPQKANYDALAAKDEKVQAEVDKINRLITSIPKLTSEKSKMLTDISSVCQPLFDELQSDALLWANYDQLVKNGLVIKSINNSKLDVASVKVPSANLSQLSYQLKNLTDQYNNAASEIDKPSTAAKPSPTPTPAAANAKKDADDKSNGIEVYKIQMVVTGSYDQIRQFITTIESLKKAVSVTTLDMTSTGLPDMIDAVIMVSYYGTKKLVPSSDSFNQWSQPAYAGGSGSPFFVDQTAALPSPSPTPKPKV